MAGRWGIAFASWIGVAGALAWLSFPGCAVAQQPPAAQSFTQPPAPQVPDRSHAPQLFRQATIARSAADQPSPTFSQSGTSASLPSGRQRHAQSEAAEPSGTQRFSPAGKESSRQEADGRSRTRKSDASSSPAHWLGDPKNVAALLTSVLIIGGGLLIFYRVLTRQSAVQWDALSVQTLGTIFFFPTLIVLAIYIDLSADAIATILGAFVGYLFNQSRYPRWNGGGEHPQRLTPGPPPPDADSPAGAKTTRNRHA